MRETRKPRLQLVRGNGPSAVEAPAAAIGQRGVYRAGFLSAAGYVVLMSIDSRDRRVREFEITDGVTEDTARRLLVSELNAVDPGPLIGPTPHLKLVREDSY